jgi:ankyrin repeat protein
MSVLLQPDDVVEENSVGKTPLAEYAAEHWVTHAQFERVSSFLRKAMEYLFDPDKPYFAAWLQLHNIDIEPTASSSLYLFAVSTKSDVTPLYLAALCGFQDLVEHLVVKYPQLLNTNGGHFMTPLVTALAGRHFQTAKHLHDNGAHVNVRGRNGRTPLHSAASHGDLEMVRVLLDYNADVNARDEDNWTPILDVSSRYHFHDRLKISVLRPDVARLLLERGADINARIDDWTPLHVAAEYGRVEVVCVLLEHVPNVDAEDNQGRTPLHVAAENERVESAEVVRMLLEHGANVGAEDNQGRTPLHVAAEYGRVEVIHVLLEHGANVDAEDKQSRTPLHKAAGYRKAEIVHVLLEHGANVGVEDNQRRAPLHASATQGPSLAQPGNSPHLDSYSRCEDGGYPGSFRQQSNFTSPIAGNQPIAYTNSFSSHAPRSPPDSRTSTARNEYATIFTTSHHFAANQ